MKLRIHHQSLRVRLTPKDLETLATQKCLADRIDLSTSVQWSYQLQLSAIQTTTLHSDGSGVRIEIPEQAFLEWIRKPDLEWSYQQTAPALEISIEKDVKPNRK